MSPSRTGCRGPRPRPRLNLHRALLAGWLVATRLGPWAFGADGDRERTVAIRAMGALTAAAPFVFSIEVQGRSAGPMYADPPGTYRPWRQEVYTSVSLSLENKGAVTVVNPWLTGVGGPNLFSLDALVPSLVPPGLNDRDKAVTLYGFDQAHRFHDTAGTGEDMLDPIRNYNVYGYSICGEDAIILTALAQKAGLRTRAGWPYGHSTMELFFDNAFRYLDGDESIVVLQADNATIAAEEDFVRDPYLMARTHSYGIKGYGRDPARDEFTAGLFWYRGSRQRNHPVTTGHTMGSSLRPGERITWLWQERRKPVGAMAERKGADFAGKHFHGRWEYAPQPAELTACRQGETTIIPFRLPYPIVGAQVTTGAEATPTSAFAIQISLDGREFQDAAATRWQEGIVDDELLALFGRSRSQPPPYQVWFRLPAAAAVAGKLAFSLDFQVAPKSLPDLALGENRFAYTDASPERDVELVWRWRETLQNAPPAAPAGPVFPGDGTAVKGSEIGFEWTPAADPDGDAIADYLFLLTASPDEALPLSSNFYALNSGTPEAGTPRFSTPHPGLLNPAQTYYWKVRARDARGCWGPWGGPWSFTVDAPGTPVPLAPTVDYASRSLKLCWRPGTAGTVPVRYRVYGGSYRGFAPHAQPFRRLVRSDEGKREFADMPANLGFETTASECTLALADSARLCPFYRVQAVDAGGTGGAFSAQIEVPGPVLLTPPEVRLTPGQTRLPLSILSAGGRLALTHPSTYRLTLAFEDVWRVEVVNPVDLMGGRTEPACLVLPHPLAEGQVAAVTVRVSGAAYDNRDRTAEFALNLTGGGAGAWVPAQPVAAPVRRVLAHEDFELPAAGRDGQLKIDEPGFHWSRCGGQGVILLARPDEKAPGYARISLPLALTEAEKAAGNGYTGKTGVEFSLVWDTHGRSCRQEVHLLQRDGQWTYLMLAPWSVVRISQKVRGQPAPVSFTSAEAFHFPYGEPVPFRWVIDGQGLHQVFQGERLLFEVRDLPGRDGFTHFRLAAIMNQPGDGSLGFGPVCVTAE